MRFRQLPAKTTKPTTRRGLHRVLTSKWFVIGFGSFLAIVIIAVLTLYFWADAAARAYQQKNQAVITELHKRMDHAANLSKAKQEPTPETTAELRNAIAEVERFVASRHPEEVQKIWLAEVLNQDYRKAKQSSLGVDYLKAASALGVMVQYMAYQQTLADLLADEQLGLHIKDEASANQLASAWDKAAQAISKLSAPAEGAKTNAKLSQSATAIAGFARAIADLYHKTDREGLKAAGGELANHLQAFRAHVSELEEQTAQMDEKLAAALGAETLGT